jgi:hypothetical protein
MLELSARDFEGYLLGISRGGLEMAKLVVHGLRDLKNELREMDKKLPKELKKVSLKAADVIADEARPNVAVVSGSLQKSLKAAGTPTGASVKFGKKSVPYAGAYHWGHNVRPQGGHMDGHPVISDALSKRYDEMVRVYEDGLEELKKDIGL